MRKCRSLKFTVGILSTALFLSIPTVIARADSFVSSEQGVAGISAILENTTDQEVADAYKASLKAMSEEESPYNNLGVSIADDYVNVRKEASTDSEVVGKLYRGCAANILETLDSGWVKIESGHVKGYIATQFLAIGDEAKSMVDKYATKYATVKEGTKTLRVREKKSTDSKTLTLVPEGETYIITNEYDDWVEILLGNDDDSDSEKDFTGYISKEFVDITVKFKYAVSIEEEQKKEKAQEEAEKAEKERKEKLAQDKAERKEAERRAEQKSSSNDSSSNNSSHNSSSNKSSDSDSSSSHGSGNGSDIANYAQKFVGNPYVWGGTSLTHGCDCSGFVQAIYADYGYSLPRTSRDQAANAGKRVSEGNLQPGDLIFYANSSGVVSHVAMYIGGGKIVHAANSRQGIIISQYKYRDVYCIKRIVD